MPKLLKVLVVEDNPADERLLRMALQSNAEFRFQVTVADRLELALERCTSGDPEIVLLDLNLPESRGKDTFAAFKDLAAKVPVIVLSGSSDEAEALSIVKEGAEDYLFKDSLSDGTLICRTIRHAVARHEMKRQLVEAREEADRASRVKSEFLSRMSHEIRTPLNAILGMSSLLKETPLNEEQKRFVEVSERAGSTLSELINSLLDLSKIESGKLVIEQRAFRLEDVIEDCCKIMGGKAKEKGLQLTCTCSPHLPPAVVGDPLRLRQILLNLIGNAIKFTETGGVQVYVEQVGHGSASVERIRFLVRDSGRGIAKEAWATIFEEFEQIEPSSYQGACGTGLGLPISKKLVELMGGALWLESVVSEGTTFYFEIPFSAPAQGSSITPPFGVRTLGPEEVVSRLQDSVGIVEAVVKSFHTTLPAGVKLLIAEDSEDNREVLSAYLAKQPLDLTFVDNGAEAVRAFQSGSYTLVLMDMQMPVMDGVAATRAIRGWERERGLRKTPIVALTAYAFDQEKQAFYEAGCDSHLSKPLSKQRLLDTIYLYTGVASAEAKASSPSPR